MRKITTIVFLFITCILNAQMHVEYVSEKSDSMALLNKKDVTKIFSEWKVLEEDFSRIPIFCDVKIRGIWGKPFNAENFFVYPAASRNTARCGC